MDKIGKIRRAYFEQARPIKDIVRTKSVSLATVRTCDVAPGRLVTPELRARLLYDFLNNPSGITASFAAGPTLTQFPVVGIVPDRLSEMLGASVTVRFTPWTLVFVSYDVEIRGSDVAQFVSGGVRVNW